MKTNLWLKNGIFQTGTLDRYVSKPIPNTNGKFVLKPDGLAADKSILRKDYPNMWSIYNRYKNDFTVNVNKSNEIEKHMYI